MSWSDDIRCLYCDGRLPLYRKITNGQFCNGAHRKAYWQEHERLAVERLHQTHDTLRAFRPHDAVQAILGKTGTAAPIEIPAPELRGFVRLPLSPLADFLAQIVAAEPLAYEMSAETVRVRHPFLVIAENSVARWIPLASPVPFGRLALPHWSSDQIAGVDPEPLESVCVTIHPVHTGMSFALRICDAGPIDVALIERIAGEFPECSFTVSVASVRRALPPVYPVSVAVPRSYDAFQSGQRPAEEPADREVPQLDRLLTIARPSALENWRVTVCEPAAIPVILRAELPLDAVRRSFDAFQREVPQLYRLLTIALPSALENGRRVTACEPAAIPVVLRSQLPLDAVRLDAALAAAEPIHAGLHELSIRSFKPEPRQLTDHLRAVDMQVAPDSPSFVLSTPAMRPRLRLAAGRRYAVRTGEVPIAIADHEPASFARARTEISLPERRNLSVAAAASEGAESVPQQDPIPAPHGLLPLACNANPSQPAAEVLTGSAGLSIPQPLRTEPVRPASRLEPLDAKPTSDFMANPPAPGRSVDDPPAEAAHVWTIAADFWKNAPRDLKMLVVALPVLLGLALHPALPKVRVVAPRTAVGMRRNIERVVSDQWKNVRQTVLDRAAVALDEDFRSGLDDWSSRGDATTEWSFDATGFVRPGPLALYRPSLGLTDYQMQFLGLIDKKALSWVVRAADFDNYYVVKLVVLKPGPLPIIGLTRYAVVNGKADSRVDVSVPIDARPDMLYRVRLDVHEATFSLTVQGQLIDSWSEPRLRHGGVGFFTARGEESRLRWVQVTHQYDMLGRLCAYLAPYNIPTTSGSWQQ